MAIKIPVIDRVPKYPGRVVLTPVSGQENTYDMVRADQPTQSGTPINKALLDQKAYTLTEDVVLTAGTGGQYSMVREALDALPKFLGGYTATIDIADGDYPGVITVSGFSGGTLILGLPERNVTVQGIVVIGSQGVKINISNIQGRGSNDGALFIVTENSEVEIQSDMTLISGGTTSESGISVGGGSRLWSDSITIHASGFDNAAVTANRSSHIALYRIEGTDNTFGLTAFRGSTISYDSSDLISVYGNATFEGSTITTGDSELPDVSVG